MDKKHKNFSVYTFVLGMVFILACWFVFSCYNSYSTKKDTSVKRLIPNGTYTISEYDGIYKIPEDGKINYNNLNVKTVTLDFKFKKAVAKNTIINLMADNTNIEIYRNKLLIYEYFSSNSCPDIVHSGGFEWFSFSSSAISKDDEIKIKITANDDYIGSEYLTRFLNNIWTGEKYEFLKHQIAKNLFHIVTALAVFIIGVSLIANMIALKVMRVPVSTGDFSCGLLMLSGAISLFMNNDYITLIFSNTFMVNIFNFTNHIFLLYFILIYFRLYLHGKTVKRAEHYFILLLSILIAVFFFVQMNGIVDYITISKHIIVPAIIIISVTLLFLFIDFRRIKNTIGKVIIISGIVLCVSIIAELIHKSVTGYFLIYAFELALIVFSAIQFIAVTLVAKRNFIQASKADAMETELFESKVSIMLSQIQPHFLYNTLVVIRQLCDIDPKTAKEAVTEFASYLRGNLDSLTLNTTIPFEKEMEHIENYISLEKKRFGDKINIDYDIEAFDFEVPSLTIQTVVENAIRHGITKRKEGGTVTITTREYLSEYTIEIRDDGIGFDTTVPHNENDTRSHIGVENSGKRIETMCGGSLKFSSTPGVGTTVLISIPK